ncbi:MAG: cytochrome c peroxidase [Acidobacteriota bacterium]
MRTLSPAAPFLGALLLFAPPLGAASVVQLSPLTNADFHEDGAPSKAKVELGRFLFFDKVLSGNENVSCATCHHPEHGTTDGVALGFGEGAEGLGPDRHPGSTKETGVHERVPRNSPALFNLGAREFTRFFHDGRVELDTNGHYEGGFITPARWKLPEGLDNALAAQAMFPVTSPTEMAGQRGENPVADARSLNNMAGKGGVWELLAGRLAAIPEYVALFSEAYPDAIEQPEDITFVHAANALAAFESTAFRADDSPYDRHLRGEDALDAEALAGLELFEGKAGCSGCHAGPLQTDHDFHAIGMPQVGPGKGDGRDDSYWRATGLNTFLEDHGRERVTSRDEDRFAFRTPSLRNVEITGPWGHDGAYATLEDIVRHHLDPLAALERYVLDDDALPPLTDALELSASGDRLGQEWLSGSRREGWLRRDGWVQSQTKLRGAIAEANELAPVVLTDAEVEQVLAFLRSLTDPRSRDLGHLVPDRVPSGLPVAD